MTVKVGDRVVTDCFGWKRNALVVKVTPTRARLRYTNGRGETGYCWRKIEVLSSVPNSLFCVDNTKKVKE